MVRRQLLANGNGNINCTSCPLGSEAIGSLASDHDSSNDCYSCRNGTVGSIVVQNISSSSNYYTDGNNALIITSIGDSACYMVVETSVVESRL